LDSSNLHFDWMADLKSKLTLFGHRNWIVVADAAYPAQAKPGIETILVGGDHIEVVRIILDAISASTHIRANVYTDLELDFVPDRDAPGASEYRSQLKSTIGDAVNEKLAHEQIIAKLDRCAQLFKIVIIKTALTIPYSSVFFELDCGYWSAEAEQRLSQTMQASGLKATTDSTSPLGV
jgi:L-fucose mutarotase/ribose pyranase (RbsD/FucU family)